MNNEIMTVFNKRYDEEKARKLLNVIKDTLIDHDNAIGVYYTLKSHNEITEENINKFIDSVINAISYELNLRSLWHIQLRKIVDHEVTYFIAGTGKQMKMLLLVGVKTLDGFSPTLEAIRKIVIDIIDKIWKSIYTPYSEGNENFITSSLFLIDAFNVRRKFIKQSIPQVFGNVVGMVSGNHTITFCLHSPIKSTVDDKEFLAYCATRIKFGHIPNNTAYSKWGFIAATGYGINPSYAHLKIDNNFIKASVGF